MKLVLTARDMSITPAIQDRVEKKTERMGRYLTPETEMRMMMKKSKTGLRTCEITVPMGGGVILRAEASTQDNLFLAIDQALEKIEKQIHRHRTKLDKRLKSGAFTPSYMEYTDSSEIEEDTAKIVRHKTFPVRPMSPEDAALQMELLGHNFFAFVNSDTEEINVLYLRKDGNLGLLEPEKN